MTHTSNKFYIVLFIILFAISIAILLIAFSGFVIHQSNKSTPRYDISHQFAIYFFPLILLGMWIYRDVLDFNILLPGIAWRSYFFLSILPQAITLWKLE